MRTDTIAAIATGMSNSGIGIVRISGGEAFAVIDRIFRNKAGKPVKLSDERSHTVHYGFIYDAVSYTHLNLGFQKRNVEIFRCNPQLSTCYPQIVDNIM